MSGNSASSRHKRRLLVVDDDIIIQLALTEVLQNAGYEVAAASDGNEALRALAESRYDVVIMDCRMTGMDGFDAVRAIRQGHGEVLNPRVPIIALTGLDSRESREACLEAGMNEQITKPIDGDRLMAVIREWLPPDAAAPNESAEQRPAGSEADEQAAGFLDKLADRFMEEISHTIDRMEVAMREQDVNILSDESHKLRGAATLIGARSLSERARELEKATNSDQYTPEVRASAEAFIEALKDLSRLADGD